AGQDVTGLAIGLRLPFEGKGICLRAGFYPPTLGEGTVGFTINGEPAPGCSAIEVKAGEALCPVFLSSIGTYSIGAAYSGTENWRPVKATESVTLNKLDPWSYIEMNPKAPVYGQGLILNALILGALGMADPTGTFTFYDGGVKLVTRTIGPDGRAG